MKEKPEFKSYYEIQYRTTKEPEAWQTFESTAKGTFRTFAEANENVQVILERIKISKDSNIHQDYSLEYRIVERKVTTETETIKTYTVE